mmetsp:Transcript_7660/g.12503  ORF Transcript_7660/g.12503 Transcript_7660/m.12503 type:complete len:124 (-) Transcript_7660:644-1015(-)
MNRKRFHTQLDQQERGSTRRKVQKLIFQTQSVAGTLSMRDSLPTQPDFPLRQANTAQTRDEFWQNAERKERKHKFEQNKIEACVHLWETVTTAMGAFFCTCVCGKPSREMVCVGKGRQTSLHW